MDKWISYNPKQENIFSHINKLPCDKIFSHWKVDLGEKNPFTVSVQIELHILYFFLTNYRFWQVVSAIKYVNTFIQDNPLLVCADEVSKIKKNLVQEQDDFKVKQKAGVITYKMSCNK